MNFPKRPLRQSISFFILLVSFSAFLFGCQEKEKGRLRLATTTSTYDSGLLDHIIPLFEETYDVNVEIVAVGTGQALALGEAADVDVVLVHARSREDAFVAAGFGTARYDVMYNDFVLLGPKDDPVDILGADSLNEALQQIANGRSLFISRGDDSGTHIRERALWQEASIIPEGAWYQAIGQGMGAALIQASESQAYILADRATYLAQKAQLDLIIVWSGGTELSNPYGVIPVNSDNQPQMNAQLTQQFIDWLVSPEIQAMIAAYQINGEQLFFPNANGACPPVCDQKGNSPDS